MAEELTRWSATGHGVRQPCVSPGIRLLSHFPARPGQLPGSAASRPASQRIRARIPAEREAELPHQGEPLPAREDGPSPARWPWGKACAWPVPGAASPEAARGAGRAVPRAMEGQGGAREDGDAPTARLRAPAGRAPRPSRGSHRATPPRPAFPRAPRARGPRALEPPELPTGTAGRTTTAPLREAPRDELSARPRTLETARRCCRRWAPAPGFRARAAGRPAQQSPGADPAPAAQGCAPPPALVAEAGPPTPPRAAASRTTPLGASRAG